MPQERERGEEDAEEEEDVVNNLRRKGEESLHLTSERKVCFLRLVLAKAEAELKASGRERQGQPARER